MGHYFSKPKQNHLNSSLSEKLLTNELLRDILKRLEFIEDKVWVLDNKFDTQFSKKFNSNS